MAWAALPTVFGNNFLEQNQKILNKIVKAVVKRNSKKALVDQLDSVHLVNTDNAFEVSTHGLRWPLSKATLTHGNTISVSNEMLENSAIIEIGVGRLLLVHHSNPTVERKE